MDESDTLWERLIQKNDDALAELARQESFLMEIQAHYSRELQEVSDTFRDLRDRLQENSSGRRGIMRRKRKKAYRRLDDSSMLYVELSKKFMEVGRQLLQIRSTIKLLLAQQREMSPVEGS